MTWSKIAPVAISIGIILFVAYLRDRSRAAAVILATMPINLPLALWVTFGGADASQAAMTAFVRSLIWGLAATVVWLVVVWIIVRQGGGLLQAVGAGYLCWGGLLAALFFFGVLAVPSR